MNEKQTNFCNLIAQGNSIQQAATKLGYKSLRTCQNLLKNNEIRAEIDRQKRKIVAEKAPTKEKLLEKLAEIAFAETKFAEQKLLQMKALRELRLMLNSKD